MRIGSLFSGAGMLDYAVESVFGAELAWHCEIDVAASKVLSERWPGVPNHVDITTTAWTDVEPVDIVCGGWPCQPFSMAGKRKGAEDDRALWPYVAGAVRALRPRFVVLENVSAVLGPEFSRVANDLAQIGYDLRWTCLRASDIGAPHRRERLFILATDADCGGGGLEREFVQRTVEGAQANDPETSSARVLDLLPTPRTSDTNGAGEHGTGGMDLRTAVALLPTPTAGDGMAGGMRSDVTWEGTTKSTGDKGNSRLRDLPPLIETSWGKYEPAIRRWETLTRPAPSPTEPNTKGNPRLSAAFSEWMMGWPACWVTQVPGLSRNDQLRIIGNGVVPQQASAALSWLLNVPQEVA